MQEATSRFVLPSFLSVAALLAVLGTVASSAASEVSDAPRHELHGVVVSAETGEPVTGAKVVAAHSRAALLFFERDEIWAIGWRKRFLWLFPARRSRVAVETVTDTAGLFRMRGLANSGAPFHLAVLHPEHGCALLESVELQNSSSEALSVRLGPPAYFRTEVEPLKETLSGRVSINLQPLPEKPKDPEDKPVPFNVRVRLRRDGTTWLSGPLPGNRDYQLSRFGVVDGTNHASTLYIRRVHLEPGQELESPSASHGETRIEGRVLGEDSRPLPHVNVVVGSWIAPNGATGDVTDAEGRYAIEGVPPGEHTLTAKRYAKRLKPG